MASTTGTPSRAQCRGDNLSGQAWFDVWSGDACYLTYDNFIYTSPTGQRAWNKDNWEESQGDFVQIFNKYLGQGNRITIPGVAGFNEFQGTLASTCSRLAGICDVALNAYCKGIDPPAGVPPCPNCSGTFGCGQLCATREGIASNAGILNFCGCYAPRPTVQSAKDVIDKNPECDPLCTRVNTIHLADGQGNIAECQEDVCVISDVSIEAASSRIGGTVNFIQICSNCNPCRCIISGIDLGQTGDEVPQLQAQFDQFCGTNSQCLVIEPNQVATPVECQTSLSASPRPSSGAAPPTTTSNLPWGLIVIVIIIIIFIFFLIIVASRESSKKQHMETRAQLQAELSQL